MHVTISSYKKAQVFKKDYVRRNGGFIKFERASANHRYVWIVDLKDGDEFDARGSAYREGATKWTAANCQSWAKFKVVNGKLVALNFDGNEVPLPHWVRVHETEAAAQTECEAA